MVVRGAANALLGTQARANQGPVAAKFLSKQFEFYFSGLVRRRRIAIGSPGATVPGDDLTGTILFRRNGAFKGRIVERMVFHVNRQPLVVRIQRRPLRYRPAFQRAVYLQPKVVMQPGGVVPLHHKNGVKPRACATAGVADLAFGLNSNLEVAFRAVFDELIHGPVVSPWRHAPWPG